MSSIVIIHCFDSRTGSSFTYPFYFNDVPAVEVAISQLAMYRAANEDGAYKGYVPAEEAYMIEFDNGKFLYTFQIIAPFEDSVVADSIW